MFDNLFDMLARKTVKKSGAAVKKEAKKKINEVTTGKNGQKLLIAAVIMSGVALIFSICRGSRPVIVNVYNGGVEL